MITRANRESLGRKEHKRNGKEVQDTNKNKERKRSKKKTQEEQNTNNTVPIYNRHSINVC